MPDVGKWSTINRLNDDSFNIMYVAAYLKLLNDQWKLNGGDDLRDRIDVWVTLYNLGSRDARKDPEPGEFGLLYNEEKEHIECLLEKGEKFNSI